MKVEINFIPHSIITFPKDFGPIVIDLPYRLHQGDLIYLESFMTAKDEDRFSLEEIDFIYNNDCFEVETLSWQNGNEKDGIWQVAFVRP